MKKQSDDFASPSVSRTHCISHSVFENFEFRKGAQPNRMRERERAHTQSVKFAVGQMQMCVCRTLHSVSHIGWGYWLCCLSFLVERIFFSSFHTLCTVCALLVSKTDHITGCNPKIHARTLMCSHEHMAIWHFWRHTCTITINTRKHTRRVRSERNSIGGFVYVTRFISYVWCVCEFASACIFGVVVMFFFASFSKCIYM